ncbi:MAG TPA: AAA family ATPase [Anaerolineales bacterium]|nr:AAA family ATPase [Anaerolineales bacterium]
MANMKIGDISDISGEVNIAGRDIYKGYTAEQVSVLLTQITSTFQPKPFDGRCPYKGLDVFEEEDAELFFGRERLVDELVGRVKESRTVFITGPSGSGKSSLVRAGLLPALKQGAIKILHSERWLYETMKPGREPLAELARVASGLAGSTSAGDEICAKGPADATIFARWCEIALKDNRDKRAVIFVDQFEEVFTQIGKEEQRAAFLNLLTHAAMVENRRVIILFAMRSDFLSNCATYPALNALLSQQFIQVGAMQPDELVSAIAQPALRVGLRIDPDLIAQIINDIEGEPGTLPLMQFALKDLLDSQQKLGGLIALTLDEYLQRGGIRRSLERHADEAFSRLDTSEQELTRSIFSGLIEVGRGTQDTRRTALFDELVPANAKAADVEAVVHKLADARLIITDEQAGKDTVTISHEKLIDAWPWLKKLVNENRDVIALQNEIASDAKDWNDNKRDASYLYTGARLIRVREQLESNKLVLSGLAREFVQTGHARQRRGQFALSGAISTIIVLLVIAVIVFSSQSSANAQLAQRNEEIANTAQAASTFAIAQQATAQANYELAQRQAALARAGELAAQSVRWHDSRFDLSLLFSIEAFHTADIPRTRSVLLDNSQTHPNALQYLRGHTHFVKSVALSPDGKILASGSRDDTIILWDMETGQPIGQPLVGHTGSVDSVAFSPDGRMLASGSEDTSIILWDVETRQPIGKPLISYMKYVFSVAFSPDGKMLAAASQDIFLWDVKTGQPIGEPLSGHTDSVNSVVFSPDGKTLASGSDDTTIMLWNVETRQPIGEPLRGHSDEVWEVAFSPDGKMLASASKDNTIMLWEVEWRHPFPEPLSGHTDSVTSVEFSPDGKILASGSYDNTIILWNVESRKPIGEPLSGHNDFVTSVVFSPDGKMLASGSVDTTIILWEVDTVGLMGQPLRGHTDPVISVAFSPDGKTLASGSLDTTIILWDVKTERPIGQPLRKHTDWVTSVAFSPDGKLLASGSQDNTIVLWDLETRQPIGEPLSGHTGMVTSVAFSPDGKMLASGSEDTTIILWDMETHQPIGKPITGHTKAVISVVFNRDGRILASGGWDTTIILWNVETKQPIGQLLNGHTEAVRTLAFSPNGKMLASGSADNPIILWDVETRQPIDQLLNGHTEAVHTLAFSPNGKMLASGSEDSTIILWDLDPYSWIYKACRRAGRNFPRSEWTRYFPAEEYRKTCEQWPLEPESTTP